MSKDKLTIKNSQTGIIGDDATVHGGINYYIRLVVSPAGLAILGSIILVTVVIVLATRNGLPTWLQTRAFPPAGIDETLIIVTDFADRSGGKYSGIDPAQYIYEKMVERAQQDGLNLRIERLYQTVDDNTVRSIGERYGAALVLWGWYDAVGITPRLEHITIPEAIPGCPTCNESTLQFETLETVGFRQTISATLPDRAIYLVYFTLGLGTCIQGDGDACLTYFNNALEVAEQDTGKIIADEAYFYRGNIYHSRQQYTLAIEDYTRAIELNRDFACAYNNRGNTYRNLGDYSKALTDYTRAIELNPDFACAYNNRGNTYRNLGDYQKALSDYTRAIELNPGFALAYTNRGAIYSDMGDYATAITNFTHAIELNPQDAIAYSNRGANYINMNEYDKALADLDCAIELNPLSACAYNNRGWNYSKMGEYNRALSDYTRAIELDPQFALAYNNRGYVYRQLDDYDRALSDYTRVIELDPQSDQAYYWRGKTYQAIDRIEAARADFEHILEVSNDDYWRGWAETALNELDATSP